MMPLAIKKTPTNILSRMQKRPPMSYLLFHDTTTSHFSTFSSMKMPLLSTVPYSIVNSKHNEMASSLHRCYSSQAQSQGDDAASQQQTTQEGLFTEILTKELQPEYLLVSDISGGCGSMYRIQAVSKKFEGISLVKQHQLVYGLLKEYIPNMHGLTMITKTPKQYQKIKEKQAAEKKAKEGQQE